jgi:hypothetical protein
VFLVVLGFAIELVFAIARGFELNLLMLIVSASGYVPMIIDTTLILFAAAPLAVICVYLHRKLNVGIFEKVLAPKEVSIARLVIACLSLNFAVFTLAYILPLAEFLQMMTGLYYPIISTYPPPSTYEELYKTQFLFTFVLPLLPGPFIIFVLRWFRQNGKKVGASLLEVMSVLLFFSIFLALLSTIMNTTVSHASLQTYWIALMAVLIPGTVGISGVLLWLIGLRTNRFHFLND